MLQAKKTGDEVDQQRFLQQQSDVCMLRLFDSFGESAPQLVFHLYEQQLGFFHLPILLGVTAVRILSRPWITAKPEKLPRGRFLPSLFLQKDQ